MKGSYAPLWCKSNYSFLEGASHPEELVAACRELTVPALALTDRDGVYGVVRAHVEARKLGVHLIVGSELSLAGGGSVVLLAEDHPGYRNLCRLISKGRLRSEKGSSSVSLEEVCEPAAGGVAGRAPGRGTGGGGGPPDAPAGAARAARHALFLLDASLR